MDDKVIDLDGKSLVEDFNLDIDDFALQTYVTGAIGSSTDFDIRLLIINDKIKARDGIIETRKEANTHLIMPPEVAQQIIDLLQHNLNDYYDMKNNE